MDVIAPQLLWIQGKCYRVNPSADLPNNNENNKPDAYLGTGIESLQM